MKSHHLFIIGIIAFICICCISNNAFGQSTSANNNFGSSKFLGWNTDSGDLFFKTNDITRMTLKNTTGFFGIGTTNPNSLFSVGSGSEFRVNANGNIRCINDVKR